MKQNLDKSYCRQLCLDNSLVPMSPEYWSRHEEFNLSHKRNPLHTNRIKVVRIVDSVWRANEVRSLAE